MIDERQLTKQELVNLRIGEMVAENVRLKAKCKKLREAVDALYELLNNEIEE